MNYNSCTEIIQMYKNEFIKRLMPDYVKTGFQRRSLVARENLAQGPS